MLIAAMESTKQESGISNDDNTPKLPKLQSTGTTSSWSRYKDPRIVCVSRAFGGKDRHSKVCTVRGLRDRRVRLSVPTALQLYDLQDKLGLNQPSKVVDWLLNAAKNGIDKLPPLQIPHGSFAKHLQHMLRAHELNANKSQCPKINGNDFPWTISEGKSKIGDEIKDFSFNQSQDDSQIQNPQFQFQNTLFRLDSDLDNINLLQLPSTASPGSSLHQLLLYQPGLISSPLDLQTSVLLSNPAGSVRSFPFNMAAANLLP